MNILVIRTHRFGDILQLTPMIGGLKRRYPGCRIHVLTDEAFTGLFVGNPDVDVLIAVPEVTWRLTLRNRPEQADRVHNEVSELAAALRAIGFDLVINRQYEWGGVLTSLVGGTLTVGGSWSRDKGFFFTDEATAALYDVTRRNRRENRRNLVDWACRIASLPEGMPVEMFFPLTAMARWKADHLLANLPPQDIVAVQLGAARSFRQWGPERFAEVIAGLVRDKGKTVLLIGSGDECDLAQDVLARLGQLGDKVSNLVGKTNIPALAGVLARCEFLLTGDTGPMHLAAAVGTPTVSLFFGTAYPWETGPYGPGHVILFSDVPCAPCASPAVCPYEHRCKRDLTPSLVRRAIEAQETYVSSGTITWSADPASAVTLLVTDRDETGEQVLQAPGLDGSYDAPRSAPTGQRQRDTVTTNLAAELFASADDLVQTFLSGSAERGLARFPELLEDVLVFIAAARKVNETHLPDLTALCREAALAQERRDIVTLTDIAEHGIKPLIRRASHGFATCANQPDNPLISER